MATIVFVHGIDNQREGPDLIVSHWLPALSGSVRLAGNGNLADRIWSNRSRPDAFECRTAYYGDLFRASDIQGDDADLRHLTPTQTDFATELSLEWLERVAERSPDKCEATEAREALQINRNPQVAQAMGTGNALRQVLKTLDRLPLVSKLGMRFVSRYIITSLTQVTQYLTDDAIREQAQATVLALVNAETRVLVGHSLGSVIAYECAHKLANPLPLLLTIGSPLGLQTIVTSHLRPPPSFPENVKVWMNAANREDVVAAEPDLRQQFAQRVPEDRFRGIWFNEAGDNPHRPETYLGRRPVGDMVIKALE